MRLIDADALDEKLDALAKKYAEQGRFEAAKDYSFVQTVLLCAPTADAVPVVHGRWVVDIERLRANCSECGRILRFSDEMQIAFLRDEEHFCYFCGAKMDMEEDNG